MRAGSARKLPIVSDDGRPALSEEEIARELAAFEESERERLGVLAKRRQWADGMTKPVMTRKQREETTLLLGGLTAAQDFLLEGALRGIGYRTEHLRVPDNEALQAGKEFGNRGQCNPTYFTVGNLVTHLMHIQQKTGLPPEEIVKKNVFVTAGACGPCRFGMYVTEYRKALRDAGFDGFRVMLFQQQGGLKQATGDDLGLELNPKFFLAIVKAILAGDVLNAIGYRIRPYEVVPGATNEAMEKAKQIVYEALYTRSGIFKALKKCRKLFEAIEVDRLRPRPKVSIIGEFWAMTTEGDGNYHLQRFLESESAENDIQLTTAWLLYNIWEVRRDTRVRSTLRGADAGRKGLEKLGRFGVASRMVKLWAAEKALRTVFGVFARRAGLRHYKLPDMNRVADLAEDYYSHDLRGGEGHMEVGKLIMNVVDAKAHMTVSVKPFGCMPSSGVSDGVQTLVQARHPGTIFCAVETSGDGATNFYSRVQMFMFKARLAAEKELQETFAKTGVTLEQVKAWLAKHPRYASPLHHPPHAEGSAGTAANLVHEVAPLIRLSFATRAARATIAGAVATVRAVVLAPVAVARGLARIFSRDTASRLATDAAALADTLRR